MKFTENDTQSQDLFAQARKLIPGGVNSPVRAFKSVGGTPPFISRASGCRIWDVDGNEYIDYIGSWGPLIAGHSHPKVISAISETASRGTSYGLPHKLEIELASEVKSRIPSVEMVRFVNSGTEAAMSALRLAKAFTGKYGVLKFAGCYHGHADSFLVSAGSGAATLGLPDSPGVSAGSVKETFIAVYNSMESVESIFSAFGRKIAAVFVEPVAGNMGVIPPLPGFLEGLRKICNKWESLLVFDEVITGFRLPSGSAQRLYGVKPDLTLLGKIIGGGLPVGAFGGKREIMELLAPDGLVYQAGTLSGNPLAMSAGLTTLSLLDDSAYERLEILTGRLETGLNDIIRKVGIDACVHRVGSMINLFFAKDPITSFHDVESTDHDRFKAFFNGMRHRGIMLPPSGYETWFVSLAHRESDIDRTLVVAEETLRECSR